MRISMIWRGHGMMGLVFETETHMKTLQCKAPAGWAQSVKETLQAEGWNMRPWDGKDSGWVATRKENKK